MCRHISVMEEERTVQSHANSVALIPERIAPSSHGATSSGQHYAHCLHCGIEVQRPQQRSCKSGPCTDGFDQSCVQPMVIKEKRHHLNSTRRSKMAGGRGIEMGWGEEAARNLLPGSLELDALWTDMYEWRVGRCL